MTTMNQWSLHIIEVTSIINYLVTFVKNLTPETDTFEAVKEIKEKCISTCDRILEATTGNEQSVPRHFCTSLKDKITIEKYDEDLKHLVERWKHVRLPELSLLFNLCTELYFAKMIAEIHAYRNTDGTSNSMKDIALDFLRKSL
jgi:DNA phosphorothioation-dependent restriction protein DptG